MTDEDAYHLAADAYMEEVRNMSLTPEQLVKYRAMADKSWQDQLTEAYADGRSDERLSTVLACIDIVAMHGGSVEIEAAMRALLDCEHDFKHDAERLLCGAAPVTEGDVIALAVAHNLGRTMKPIGMQTGDVFVTDQSYRTGELLAFAAAVADAERKRCAQIARNGCLVPPDGGSPTEDEAALCEEIARRIREVV